MESIKSEEIVLPDIQRDFVWAEKQIEKLFDSIMRGYPIGIVLLWETYDYIQYRRFIKEYQENDKYLRMRKPRNFSQVHQFIFGSAIFKEKCLE